MPAWSMPGTQTVFFPCMRARRIMASSIAFVSAWPMCRAPVTFGGGMTIAKGSPSSSGSAWNSPASTQSA